MRPMQTIIEELAAIKRESQQRQYGDAEAVDRRLDRLIDLVDDMAHRLKAVDASLDRLIEGGGSPS